MGQLGRDRKIDIEKGKAMRTYTWRCEALPTIRSVQPTWGREMRVVGREIV